MTLSASMTLPSSRPPKMPGQLGYRKAVAKTELSNSLDVTEDDLGELWSRVCAALEENAPTSASPAPARDMAGEIISGPAEKKMLPAASPHTVESTVASAKTTGTKSSPWSIAVAASKQDGCPGPPQFTDFPGNICGLHNPSWLQQFCRWRTPEPIH